MIGRVLGFSTSALEPLLSLLREAGRRPRLACSSAFARKGLGLRGREGLGVQTSIIAQGSALASVLSPPGALQEPARQVAGEEGGQAAHCAGPQGLRDQAQHVQRQGAPQACPATVRSGVLLSDQDCALDRMPCTLSPKWPDR